MRSRNVIPVCAFTSLLIAAYHPSKFSTFLSDLLRYRQLSRDHAAMSSTTSAESVEPERSQVPCPSHLSCCQGSSVQAPRSVDLLWKIPAEITADNERQYLL